MSEVNVANFNIAVLGKNPTDVVGAKENGRFVQVLRLYSQRMMLPTKRQASPGPRSPVPRSHARGRVTHRRTARASLKRNADLTRKVVPGS